MGRLRTGIPDLDLILGGGLEPGSLVILARAPGTGKTILAAPLARLNAEVERRSPCSRIQKPQPASIATSASGLPKSAGA